MNSIISKKEKEEYVFESETGDAIITVYRLFPGIEVTYVSVHMSQFDFSETESNSCDRYIGFHYCMEGRIEQETDDEFFYLMPGDCSVVIQDKQTKKFSLPLRHYHGISIGIDTNNAPHKFSEFIGNESVEPINVAKRLCGKHHSVVLRSVEPLKHIFTESYTISESLRADYLKIKLLELLYALRQIDISETTYEEYSVPRTQTELVKKVAGYISENLTDKLTLKELTAMFGVSDTYLQKSFRAVYGMPVAAFIRAQKIQKAALELIHTDRSIDEIAEDFGYINESKFSAVFKKLMGDPPSVFRKEHSKIKII